MRRTSSKIAFIVSSIASILPSTAFADDLSVLVFIVFIWPAAGVLALPVIVLFIICIVQLIRGAKGSGLAKIARASVIVSLVAWVLFTTWTLYWVGTEASRHLGLALWHIAGFAVVVLPCLIMGVVAWRRA